ncbi:GRAS family protein TF80-like [Quercus robur]|uniref:GRAS family protein TF80-like n=1 Tax=Quercus robur TaxID=38942 RepID=UPI00216361D5|nr:GRAS family protein TF80-like [Quercus robur]XP_050283458.1 GRAS family protein TF80-like [Quercus robur]
MAGAQDARYSATPSSSQWMSLSPGLGSPIGTPLSEKLGVELLRMIEECGYHVAASNMPNANIMLELISRLASANGSPIQRIAAYVIEAFAERMLKTKLPGLYNAFNSTKISLVSEENVAQRLFYNVCPFIKVAYLITNQAIIEAMEGEKWVHIIDLYSFEPEQWIDLLHTFKARPEGPPCVKISGIHDQRVVLEQMAVRLMAEASKLEIPFHFIPIVSKLENVDTESFCVNAGEAIGVSAVFQLHSLLAFDEEVPRRISPVASKRPLRKFLDEVSPDFTSPSSILSPSFSPKMKNFLSSLRRLSPKVMVIAEQEANHNGFSLTERVKEALDFYAPLFDCLDSIRSIAPTERQMIEKMIFGDEIKNIIACEGVERKERHEKLEKWILRLEQAGFGRVELSYYNSINARKYLQNYGNDGYNIKEKDRYIVLCWNWCPLFSISAWQFGRQK